MSAFLYKHGAILLIAVLIISFLVVFLIGYKVIFQKEKLNKQQKDTALITTATIAFSVSAIFTILFMFLQFKITDDYVNHYEETHSRTLTGDLVRISKNENDFGGTNVMVVGSDHKILSGYVSDVGLARVNDTVKLKVVNTIDNSGKEHSAPALSSLEVVKVHNKSNKN